MSDYRCMKKYFYDNLDSPNNISDYRCVGLPMCRSIDVSDYRCVAESRRFRSIDMSDYRSVGLSMCRTIDMSDYRGDPEKTSISTLLNNVE